MDWGMSHRLARIVGPDGNLIGDRGSAGLPSTEGGLPGSSKLLSWVPGRGLDRHRADVGKRIPAGKYVNWQIHYNPTGKPEKDRSRLGIWFNKADPSSTRRSRTTPNIPPYVENWSLTGITPVTEDITLYAMSPHMHLRGKSLKWVITYTDGRDQVILNIL